MNKIKIAIRSLLLRESTKNVYKNLRKAKIFLFSVLPDELYVKLNIYLNTGLILNLKNPQMHVEKVNWLKLNYRNSLQTEYTDKYLVRSHLKKKNYENFLPNLIGVYDKFEHINLDLLPEKVFLKTNHMSGVNQVLEKSKTNINKTKSRFNKALNSNYYKNSREWNYLNISPKILVEEYLDMSKYLDYKFFVFDGKAEFFAVIKEVNDEYGNQSIKNKFNLYDMKQKPLNVDVKREKFDDTNFKFSEFIPEMKKMAENLANPFPFCRVDFLVSKNKFLFGEITFHPNGGEMVMYPLKNEYFYGNKIDLNKIHKEHIKQ